MPTARFDYVFLLQELLGVPTGFDYVFYKYGPFSRGLREELAAMRADGFLDLMMQPAPYGPSLLITDLAQRQLVRRWPKTLRRYEQQLEFIAEHLGVLGVGDLERLATALWVRRELPRATTPEQAARVHELKPHLSEAQVVGAPREVESMEADAEALSFYR